MDKSNSIFISNELDANRFSAKVMLLTIIFVGLVYLLNVLGIFIVPMATMTVAMASATVLLLIPSFLIYVLKLKGRWIKYVIVAIAALMVAIISTFLKHHVVLLYIYAIAIASLYFSKRLSWFSVIFSIAVLSASQILGYSVDGITDNNVQDMHDILVFGVVPRGISLLTLSLIFTALATRTRSMLGNMMGAEEQKSMLDNMIMLREKSASVSETLSNSVRQLSTLTDDTSKASVYMSQNAALAATGAQNTINHIEEAELVFNSMSESLDDILKKCRLIAELSNEINVFAIKNSDTIRNASEKMMYIDKTTTESKDTISKLKDRSNEISKIVDIINGISAKTNLLALNAAIESARAGELGKGFAVVAGEIRKLAEQTQASTGEISALVAEVLSDTQNAANCMDISSNTVNEGLLVMKEADQSSVKVSEAIELMGIKLNEVNEISQRAADKSHKLTTVVTEIRDVNNRSLKDLESIAAASAEQLSAIQQVSASVDIIGNISEELLIIEK